MPLATSREEFVTCAVTGAGATQERSLYAPRTPPEIAARAIGAAEAGAAIVCCHVRDPARCRNLWRARGQLAADPRPVERAVALLKDLGARVMGPGSASSSTLRRAESWP